MSDTKNKVTSRLRHLFTPFSTRFIVGITVIVLSFVYYFCNLFLAYRYGKDQDGNGLTLALVSLVTNVLSWFFGSSKSESDKAKTEQVRTIEKDIANEGQP